MSKNISIALAKDKMMRVSPLKLSLVANSIVNKTANSAINQLKFSNKRISKSVLKVPKRSVKIQSLKFGL